ncbi:condensation domain-containing protein, partial [Paenibacillus sp. ISL-20]|uniref:condensation domain-containing protein n=1 Tax=Paenibacillus sp. ISL-20 TaxID=2819163 RepID=UPI001BE7F28B
MLSKVEYENLHGYLKRNSFSNKGIIIIDDNGSDIFLAYNTLYDKAKRLLYHLQGSGVGKDTEVILQLHHYEDFLISFWACILGGAIPVPVSVANNTERLNKLQKICSLLKNPIIICNNQSYKSISPHLNDIKLVNFSALDHTETCYGKVIEDQAPDELAFIQFSSGSTGDPKGVMVTHENVIVNANAIANRTTMNQHDSSLSWMPLTHDMGLIMCHLLPVVYEMNHSLINTSFFIRKPVAWFEYVNVYKPTILASPNFGFKFFLNNLKKDKHDWNLSSVRVIINGAEPISIETCTDFIRTMSAYKLSSDVMANGYGLAEGTVAVSIINAKQGLKGYSLDRRSLAIGNRVKFADPASSYGLTFADLGKVIENCEIRICNDDGAVLEDLVIGHVQINGKSVTRGYYLNEKSTSDVLTEDGWLRTGDLGFMDSGNLIITGRFKDIIIINGQNYYPHDIESLVEQIDGIGFGRAAVCGAYNENKQMDEIIVFVTHLGEIAEFITLSEQIRANVLLTANLHLDHVIPLKRIPKTTSGKIQRFLLASQYQSGKFDKVLSDIGQLVGSNTDVFYEKTDDYNIEELKLIWLDLLKTLPPNSQSSFFHLGGNSLLAGQLSARIAQRFKVNVSISDIFQHPTLAAMMVLIATAEKTAYENIKPVAAQTLYIATSAQRRLYALQHMDVENTHYNVPYFFIMESELDKKKFEKSINTLISRHEVFRTSFEVIGEDLFQRIHETVPFAVEYLEADDSDIDARIADFVRPFDLSEPSLLRVCVIKLQSGQYLLLIDIHHIISDGMSVSIIARELSQLYAEKELPDLKIQYKDYAAWQQTNAASEEMQTHEAYWLNTFADGVPVLNLPTDYVRPVMQSFDGDRVRVRVPKEVTQGLRRLAQESGSTLYMVLLSAYSTLLGRYTGQNDIVIGTPIAGRTHADVENMVGMFVNTLALRSQPELNKSFNEFLQEMKEITLAAFEHQEYPFEQLVDKLSLQRDIGRNAVYDVMFVLQNMEMRTLEIGEERLSPYLASNQAAKFDLTLTMTEDAEEIELELEYGSKLFRKDTIERMAAHLLVLLNEVQKDSEVALGSLELVTEEEKQTLLYSFNATEAAYPREKTIHELFEEQALRTPAQTAVVFK